MIRIGDRTTLSGFENLDKNDILIAKKLLGSYIRLISDSFEDCRINVELSGDDGFRVTSNITTEDDSFEGSSFSPNLFVAIDRAMKSVMKESDIEK